MKQSLDLKIEFTEQNQTGRFPDVNSKQPRINQHTYTQLKNNI